MRNVVCIALACLLTASCSSSEGSPGAAGATGAGGSSNAGSSGSGGATSLPDGGSHDAAAPSAVCEADFAAVDSSHPDQTVGTGTPASCTEAALSKAVVSGGVIAFDCGTEPFTLTVTHELKVVKDTTLDGAGKVTLSGGGVTRILSVPSDFNKGKPTLTVQHLTFEKGKSTGADDTTAGGGAIWTKGGSVTVVDCRFYDNQGPGVGQDVAGGAIYDVGKGVVRIRDSVFEGNHAGSGGAVGILHADLHVFNSTFSHNQATGYGGNPGHGGNGGAIYIDGTSQTVSLCGVTLDHNQANVAGGALFRVSNDHKGPMRIERSTVSDNLVPEPSGDDHSSGGGMFLMGVQIELGASSFVRNRAKAAGALFLSGQGTSLHAVNSTLANNVASSSLAGGIFMSQDVTGQLLNCTLLRNEAPGDKAFGGATYGGTGVELKNCVIAESKAGNGWNPISCTKPMKEGGGNIQWPVKRAGGGSDDPDALCSPKILVADPKMGTLTESSEHDYASAPSGGSPAIGLGHGCPKQDQLGNPRGEPCTAGAVEVVQ